MFNEFLASINTAAPSALIPLIVTTGLLDGISPCVIAILIFFIAFLLGLKRGLKNIFALGLVYISVVFLVYLGVGVGLFSGIVLFGRHHFFAQLGSWLLIFLGAIQVKEYFWPGFPAIFRIPKVSAQKIKGFLEKATLPGVILAAFLVGLCAVPCSGGIYASITSLLASKTTYWTGLFYLVLYNLMVIVPLLILLAFATNPITLAKIAEFRQKHERTEKLIMGLIMIALGTGILIFFI